MSKSMSFHEVVNRGIIHVGIVDCERCLRMIAVFQIEGGLSSQGVLSVVISELSCG